MKRKWDPVSRFTMMEVGNKEENMCWETESSGSSVSVFESGSHCTVLNLHGHLWNGCSLHHVGL